MLIKDIHDTKCSQNASFYGDASFPFYVVLHFIANEVV